MVSHKTTPGVPTHNWERPYQTGTPPGGARVWCPTLGILAPGICTRMMSSQNVWLKKPMGLTSAGGWVGGSLKVL